MKNNGLKRNGSSPPLRVLVADDVQATRHTTCLMLKIIPNVNILSPVSKKQTGIMNKAQSP